MSGFIQVIDSEGTKHQIPLVSIVGIDANGNQVDTSVNGATKVLPQSTGVFVSKEVQTVGTGSEPLTDTATPISVGANRVMLQAIGTNDIYVSVSGTASATNGSIVLSGATKDHIIIADTLANIQISSSGGAANNMGVNYFG